jgi:hypothetical protein
MQYKHTLHLPKGDSQRPCFAILRRTIKFADWQSDFRGQIQLEDGRRYSVGISVGIAPDGENFLRLYLRAPQRLKKTPLTPPGTLGVVR